ncbi:MAG: glycerol-3-phosphate ABC transporter ATP-binding protein [Elusimicrobia bacterium HGW-Elusimicrobia-1]|jgi:multiple sugar transport system ATP-binding protein|nr:MAG: glycerol-3-phosphate ABC transporter ATP-binding protein [Elusimicrobia bacterium HGW-Elusimicrobia-1]
MAQVIIKNVWKKYGDAEIVKNFNLTIADKEFCILVGPSGCGKTTTLRMIAGLEDISSGEILIGDVVVNGVPPKDRDIAMVFQNYALYPHMNVRDNMAFGLKLRGYSKKLIDERVNEAADILNIKHLLARKPKDLSGGQRQRVAVGRAIVRKPKVFLFDEPLSNLDAKLRAQMRAELKKLHQRLQATMIYVTHDQIEAMTMGDKICVMKDGVILQVDEPIKLYSDPVDKFVAGFIGSPPMNFFDCKVAAKDDAVWISEGSFDIKLSAKFTAALKNLDGKMVTAGIRPEDIHDKLFYRIGPMDGNIFTATVDVIEPLGAEIYLHMNTGKNSFVAKVDSHNTAKPNQILELVVNVDKIKIFDKETETALA